MTSEYGCWACPRRIQPQTKGSATTPAAFRAVLRYMYTDGLACDDESVVDVMCKAREYDLRHLLKLCARYCADNLAPPNAIPWLVQAEEQQLGELRDTSTVAHGQNRAGRCDGGLEQRRVLMRMFSYR